MGVRYEKRLTSDSRIENVRTLAAFAGQGDSMGDLVIVCTIHEIFR